MFRVYITETIYDHIVNTEEQKTISTRFNLYKLLKQQLVEMFPATDTNRHKTHLNYLLKQPSALYVLDAPNIDTIAIQKLYGIMCQSGIRSCITTLIDSIYIYTSKVLEKLGHRWDTVLDGAEYMPSNALLLTGRYLLFLLLFTKSSLNNNSTQPLDATNQTYTTLNVSLKLLPKILEVVNNTFLYAVNIEHRDKYLSIGN